MITRREFSAGLGALLLSSRAHPMDYETYRRLGLDKTQGEQWEMRVNGRSNLEIVDQRSVPENDQYKPSPEAYPVPGVPRGTVKKYSDWSTSKVYAATQRDIWIYTPANMKPLIKPNLMVFNDGIAYLREDGLVRATRVLDSLIFSGEIPPTVGVFIMPGRVSRDWKANRTQRSYEYDSVTDRYVKFLTNDVLPFVKKEIGVAIASKPSQRTICGISSGGICAFSAAWFRPDAFGRVLSHCGSFVNIRGGHNYPYLVKSTLRKPIRAFLQSGSNDANIISGNWPLANKMMAAALEYAGYESKFVFGEGAHSLHHGGAIFADSLRWLEKA